MAGFKGTTDFMAEYSNKVNYSDIIDNLTTADSNKALSANQGKVINDKFADYFKRGDKGNPTDVNNTSLVGTYFAQDTVCSNLPTSNDGYYYRIACFGVYQIASRFGSTTGFDAVYSREYVNDKWYPWVNQNAKIDFSTKINNLNDTSLTGGFYQIDANSTGSPTTTSGKLLNLISPLSSWGEQIVFENTNSVPLLYIRNKTNSGFGSWATLDIGKLASTSTSTVTATSSNTSVIKTSSSSYIRHGKFGWLYVECWTQASFAANTTVTITVTGVNTYQIYSNMVQTGAIPVSIEASNSSSNLVITLKNVGSSSIPSGYRIICNIPIVW